MQTAFSLIKNMAENHKLQFKIPVFYINILYNFIQFIPVMAKLNFQQKYWLTKWFLNYSLSISLYVFIMQKMFFSALGTLENL